MRGALALVLLMVLAACVRMTRIEREDWGAIPRDATIRITTLDGTTRTLTEAVALMDAIEGVDVDSDATLRVPLDSIEYIDNRSGPSAFPILVAAAAVISAIAIIDAQGESDVRPPPSQASCPFLYSFDGTEYVFDSETYAGAITRGLERADLDNLDHLAPVDGRFRLLLTNERPETEYTDALTLLVVDHPVGAAVYPDSRGASRMFKDGERAASAQGVRGGDYLDVLAERDGRLWTGDPVETADISLDAELRDGVVLRFPRPSSDRALLAVEARNTELAPLAIELFLGLQGDDVVDWYRRVDHDTETQAMVREWITREGTLHVSVWVDGGWELQDMLLDVGPLLSKTQLATLDLTGVEGDEVRIRIESARGLWTLDWVALGVEADVTPVVTELAPARAEDARGRDLSAVLALSDGAYYTALEGDRVELEFRVPPGPAAGWERTVLARATGFYHLHVRGEGPAQTALSERILTEPLFGNRYLLGLLRLRASGRE